MLRVFKRPRCEAIFEKGTNLLTKWKPKWRTWHKNKVWAGTAKSSEKLLKIGVLNTGEKISDKMQVGDYKPAGTGGKQAEEKGTRESEEEINKNQSGEC